jgi:hypothetical protein
MFYKKPTEEDFENAQKVAQEAENDPVFWVLMA